MTTLNVLPFETMSLAAEDDSSNSLVSRRSTEEQAELTRIGTKIESAQTLAEVVEAQAALRAWANQRPEERARLSAIFEQLAMLEDSARTAQAEAQAMRLTPEECQQRDRLFALRRRVCAEDAPEVFAAALGIAGEALANWEALHPEAPQLSPFHAQLDMEAYVARALQEAL